MAKRWSPVKATIVTVLLVAVIVLLAGGVYATSIVHDDAVAEKIGERIGRALLPVLVLAGIIAYFVQKSRINDDNKPDRR